MVTPAAAIFRVFLASSSELSEERQRFPGLLRDINRRPDIQRRFELSPVLWERDAFGITETIHDTIRTSVEFETLHVVVLVVWNRLGEGTLREYEEARALWKVHRRPLLLVFFRRPPADADPTALADVLRFKRRLLDEGVATNEYTTAGELDQRLAEQLPRCLPAVASEEPTSFRALRRRFFVAGGTSVLITAVTMFVCRIMSFPTDRVTETGVYLVIFAPVLLFLAAAMTTWYYHRLLGALKRLWHSPDWTDEAAYEAFRHLVPGGSIPARLRARFPTGWSSTILTIAGLGLVFLAPVVGQYQAIFEELLVWEYTVSREFTVDRAGQARSRHVDRDRDRTWLLARSFAGAWGPRSSCRGSHGSTSS
jgi:hypothetical protein